MSQNTQQKVQKNQTAQIEEQLQYEIVAITKLIETRKFDVALHKIAELYRKYREYPEIIVLQTITVCGTGSQGTALDAASKGLNKEPKSPYAVGEYVLVNAICGNVKEAFKTLIQYCETQNGINHVYIQRTACELANCLLKRDCEEMALPLAFCLMNYDAVCHKATDVMRSIVASHTYPIILRALSMDCFCPDDFPAKEEFEKAFNLIAQLRWNEALKLLISVSKHSDKWAASLRNVAVLQYWLQDTQSACDTLKSYAAIPNLPAEEAAEAEALRLTFDPDLLGEPQSILTISYKITDANAALEKLLSSPFFVSLKFTLEEFTRRGIVPPKGAFRFLNRPALLPDTEINIDTMPSQFAICTLYGKETDRDARIVFNEVAEDEKELFENALKQVLGNLLITDMAITSNAGYTTRTGQTLPRLVDANEWQTSRLTRELLAKIFEQHVINVYIPKFLNTTFESLGNKTPVVAAKEPAYKIRVLGLLKHFELFFLDKVDEITFSVSNHLRQILGYPLLEKIAIQGETDDEQLLFMIRQPMWRWYRFDPKTISYVALVEGSRNTALFYDAGSMVNFAKEVLAREQTGNEIEIGSRAYAYRVLADAYMRRGAFSVMLDLIEKAKAESVANNLLDAEWYMREIPILVAQRQTQRCQDSVKYVIEKYKDDEEVMSVFIPLLYKFGILQPDGESVSGGQEFAGEGTAQTDPTPQIPPGLWTPDNSQQPPQQTTSKLWTPD
ncbi:MAG: hypothetical protein LBJ00_08935 [Planctomycetaceae bacterium]|jgi:hypothetical protein|nr:hypothetical protein [Planctomycetaceae bacterium]